MSYLRSVLNATLKYSEVIQTAASSETNSVAFPDTNFGKALAVISRTVKAKMGTRVYMVTLNGFDTHANQSNKHQELLTDMSESISAFYQDLENSGMEKDVLTMTFSEFGRRVNENGSNGTDHGTAAPMLLFGPALDESSFIGTHPNLSDLDDKGNLKYTQDYIDVYATVMQDWLCIDSGVINQSLSRSYQVLDLGFNCSGSLGVDDDVASLNFKHTPIYDQDEVFIRVENNSGEEYEISLYNIFGQNLGVLAKKALNPGRYDIRIQDKLPRLSAGMYIYNIKKNNTNFSKKILIQ